MYRRDDYGFFFGSERDISQAFGFAVSDVGARLVFVFKGVVEPAGELVQIAEDRRLDEVKQGP